MADRPLILLVEPQVAKHRHADELRNAGFRTLSVPVAEADVDCVVAHRPAVIAAELDGSAAGGGTLEFARRLREQRETQLIPLVIYGHELSHQDIESTARVGALWLQLEPNDGARFVAAVRGLIAASWRKCG
jgi:CheY-like chemotaxis protein